jgi:tetratricopeptide (TPR) repeat protein
MFHPSPRRPYSYAVLLLVVVPCCAYFHMFPRQNSAQLLSQIDQLLRKSDPHLSWRANVSSEIEQDHVQDAQKYNWLDDGYKSAGSNNDDEGFHWMNRPGTPRLILRTETPLIDSATAILFRNVASDWWKKKKISSAFTYQRQGNYEAHVDDLCQSNQTFREAFRALVVRKIYPLVREHFLDEGWSPHIYDSLLIRYNASASGDAIGAGQPLHRDLGLVSINIMLNDDFQGGGTLFEAQLQDDPLQPLKPLETGNALVHWSNHRHAGAGTRVGVRDILVVFLSASDQDGKMSATERAARLKGRSTDKLDYTQRAILHRSAIDLLPNDGEAWHYIGMCLDMIAARTTEASQLAARSLMQAASLIPNDARLLNNMGLVLGRQGYDCTNVEKCYTRSLELHSKCKDAGCDVKFDMETAALNYGLFLASRDCWELAIQTLNLISYDAEESSQHTNDAANLLDICKKQFEATSLKKLL